MASPKTTPSIVTDPSQDSASEGAEIQQHFLECVRQGHSFRSAAEQAGIEADKPYIWQKSDEAFASALRVAEQVGTDLIEEEAYRRAVKGVEKPIYRGGEVVGHMADYSDAMLMFLLKARRPERYGGKASDKALDADALAERLNLKGARDGLKRKFASITAGR